ncbi:MAG TPA: beta-L-arabinofuranosidase domain-containing protein, partial [Longimicrobiales bacterium]|nr:beta-L-arabinofuranosidase domain-containing protein [Longimicrobiales bacterium]
FGDEPSAAYADFYERALYNDILASQDPDSGMCTYFQALRPGYLKLYHTPIDSFWCCTGSGMENHAKYNDSIYFHGGEDLWVNLFVPSVLTWRDRGMTVTQSTAFPEEEGTRLTLRTERPVQATVNVRVPSWAAGAGVTVNGRPWEGGSRPGSYVAIDREWRTGDAVEVRLPMRLRTVALPGVPDQVAVAWGPIVLAGRLGRDGLYPGADILRNERTSGDILQVPVEVPVLAGDPEALVERIHPVEGEPLTFETSGLGRPRDVTLIPYHRMAHERYNVYWRVEAPEGVGGPDLRGAREVGKAIASVR